MTQNRVVLMLAIALPGIVAAQSSRNYECTNGDGGPVRRVEIAYSSAGNVPCEVRYYKDGTPQVLWQADTQTGYCESQAEDFITQLQSMGWTCTDKGTTAAAAPASRDETAAPAPGPTARN